MIKLTCKTFFHFTVFTLCSALLIYQTTLLCCDYLAYPTITIITTSPKNVIELPGVNICAFYEDIANSALGTRMPNVTKLAKSKPEILSIRNQFLEKISSIQILNKSSEVKALEIQDIVRSWHNYLTTILEQIDYRQWFDLYPDLDVNCRNWQIMRNRQKYVTAWNNGSAVSQANWCPKPLKVLNYVREFCWLMFYRAVDGFSQEGQNYTISHDDIFDDCFQILYFSFEDIGVLPEKVSKMLVPLKCFT